MAYYIGTKTKCEEYNQQVCEGEKYKGSTSSWSNVIRHATQSKFAIVKHEKYSSDMQEVESLSEDWFTSF